MIGIDTNVLVRYYVDDDGPQHRKAINFIDSNDIFLNNIVILETFWVLSQVYRQSSEKICEIIDHLRRLSNVQFESESSVALALIEYRDNGCDFADAFIGAINREHGCNTATFDRAAIRKLGFMAV